MWSFGLRAQDFTRVNALESGEEYYIFNANSDFGKRNWYLDNDNFRTRQEQNRDYVTFRAVSEEVSGTTYWSFQVTSDNYKDYYLGRGGNNIKALSGKTLWTIVYDSKKGGFTMNIKDEESRTGMMMNGSNEWVVSYADLNHTDWTDNSYHWCFYKITKKPLAANEQPAQFKPSYYNEDKSTLLGEYENFSDGGETTRFRSISNSSPWKVENYSIDGGAGMKGGIDTYWEGKNSLQLGRWEEGFASFTDEDASQSSRIYQQITLPAGKYFFGAAYDSKPECDGVYMFASTSKELKDAIVYCNVKNVGGWSNDLYGITFSLATSTTLYLGYQANSTGWHSEFRAKKVALYENTTTDEGVLTSPWTQLTEMPEAENIGNYFFVLKDYPRALTMVSKNGTDGKQGSGNKTLWYTANVNPGTNKDALLSFYTDGDYQIMTSVTTPDIMFQTNAVWNYQTGNNGGGDLSWGRAKYSLTSDGWIIQNGRYGDANYLGPWGNNFEDNAEVAFNTSGARTGHFDLFAITRGAYVSNYETGIATASLEHPVDLTYILNNPGAENQINGVFGWVNGNQWTAQDNIHFDKVGNRYFEKYISNSGGEASDIYQEFTDLPAGFYKFSAVALGGEGLQLYANGETVYAPSESARVSVIAEVTESGENAGKLRVGAKAFNVTDTWVKFDDVKLEYIYREVPSATLGLPVWSVDGKYLQSIESVTVAYSDATTNQGKTFAILDGDAVATLTATGETTANGTLSLSDKTITISFSDVTLTPGKDYTITLPAGTVGFEDLMSNETTSVTFHTPTVFDGTYFFKIENEGGLKNQYLSRGKNYGTHITADKYGLPIKVATDGEGKTTLKPADTDRFLRVETNGYECWADNTDNDNRAKFNLIACNNPFDGKFYVHGITTTRTNDYFKYNDGDIKETTKLYADSKGEEGSSDCDGHAIQFSIETAADHADAMQALIDAQAATAATAAYASGLGDYTSLNGITSMSALETALPGTVVVPSTVVTSVVEKYQGNQPAKDNHEPEIVYSNTVNITKPGLYKFSMQAFYRAANNTRTQPLHTNGFDFPPVLLFFGDARTQIKSLYDDPGRETAYVEGNDAQYNGQYYANNTTAATMMLQEGRFNNDVWFYVSEAGEYSYGIEYLGFANNNQQWLIYSTESVAVTFYGNITIDEDVASAPAEITANVNLVRTLSKDYWNTFCSPVDITADEITATFGVGTKVREMNTDAPVTNNVIPFKAATAITAGVPYLVKPAQTVVNPTFNNKTIEAEGQTVKIGDFKFIGIIAKTSIAANAKNAETLNFFLKTNGNLVQPSETGDMKGMRAYFNVPSSVLSSGPGVKLFLGDMEVGIDMIDGQPVNSNAVIYDLSGRRVAQPTRGLYIVNGQKVAVK